MLFQRINRSDPEKVFIVVLNGYATASLTSGQPVMWDLADKNGVTVSISTGAKTPALFAGVAAETIASAAYGLIQVFGYHPSVVVTCSTTGKNIVVGDALYLRTAAFNFINFWATSGATPGSSVQTIQSPAACALEAYTMVGTTTTIKAIIHAM